MANEKKYAFMWRTNRFQRHYLLRPYQPTSNSRLKAERSTYNLQRRAPIPG